MTPAAHLALLAAMPASIASAQPAPSTPTDLRAAVLAQPAAAPSAGAAARNAADLGRTPGATRLDTAHVLVPSPTAPATGQPPLKLKPSSEDVGVDYTFDSADPLDGRFSGDRPGLMGVKGRFKF